MVDDLNEIKQKTVSGLFWRFSERICAQIVSFCVTVVLARILLPDDYGIVAIVNIFIIIADSFISSGISASLIQKKDSDALDFSTIFYASLGLAFVRYWVLFFSATFISSIYKNSLLTPILRIMGIKFFISAVNSVQQAYVAKKNDF